MWKYTIEISECYGCTGIAKSYNIALKNIYSNLKRWKEIGYVTEDDDIQININKDKE